MKIQNSLRRLYGHLNYDNFKRSLQYGDKILNLTRRIAEVGKESKSKSVEDLSNKILNNRTFNDLEKVSKVSNGIINAYDTHKSSGLFNKTHPNLNQEGVDYAIHRRNQIKPRLNENQIAENIVGNISQRRTLT